MRFQYEKVEWFDKGNYTRIYRPNLKFSFKKGQIELPSDGLLDSGADLIVLPLFVAKYFEVPYEKAEKIHVQIADGRVGTFYKIPYKIHGISLTLNGVMVKETLAFSEGQDTALLGQDFFKHFQITFNRKKKYFDLKSTSK